MPAVVFILCFEASDTDFSVSFCVSIFSSSGVVKSNEYSGEQPKDVAAFRWISRDSEWR